MAASSSFLATVTLTLAVLVGGTAHSAGPPAVEPSSLRPGAATEQEAVDPSTLAHVQVHIQGTEGALFQQRVQPGPWRALCTIPCHASVVPDPLAEHRVLEDDDTDADHPLRVVIEGDDEDRLVVNARVSSPGARQRLMNGGAAIVSVGGIAAIIGMVLVLGGAYPDSSCEACRGRALKGGLLLGGFVGVVGGGVMMLVSLGKRSSVTVEPATDPTKRAAEWTGPRVPALPPFHTNLLDLAF